MPAKKKSVAPPIPGPAGKVLGPLIIGEGHDTDVAKIQAIAESVFSRKNLFQKGNLKRNQIVHLIRGQVYEKQFKCPLMGMLVDAVVEMSISDGGLGRKDLRTVLQTIVARRPEQQGTIETSLQKRLM